MKYAILIKRVLEDNYSYLCEKGNVKLFDSEEKARIFGRENIEGKSKFTSSWTVTEYIK